MRITGVVVVRRLVVVFLFFSRVTPICSCDEKSMLGLQTSKTTQTAQLGTFPTGTVSKASWPYSQISIPFGYLRLNLLRMEKMLQVL